MPKFEIFFTPQHGDILCFRTGGKYHCTRNLEKENQLRLTFFQKASLLRQMRRLLNLHVDGVLEDIVPKKGKTSKKIIYERRVDFDVRKDIYTRKN